MHACSLSLSLTHTEANTSIRQCSEVARTEALPRDRSYAHRHATEPCACVDNIHKSVSHKSAWKSLDFINITIWVVVVVVPN